VVVVVGLYSWADGSAGPDGSQSVSDLRDSSTLRAVMSRAGAGAPRQASARGVLYTWGRNTKGQLGTGSLVSSKVPSPPPPFPVPTGHAASGAPVPTGHAASGAPVPTGHAASGAPVPTGHANDRQVPVRVDWRACPTPNSWTCSPTKCEAFCDAAKCVNYGPTNAYWTEADMHCMKPHDRVWDTAKADHPTVLQVPSPEKRTLRSMILSSSGAMRTMPIPPVAPPLPRPRALRAPACAGVTSRCYQPVLPAGVTSRCYQPVLPAGVTSRCYQPV
jgi:hypothetical protein